MERGSPRNPETRKGLKDFYWGLYVGRQHHVRAGGRGAGEGGAASEPEESC